MLSRPSRLLAVAFAAAFLPAAAGAQRSGWVAQSFRSASAQENGFLHGQVLIDYQFGICAGGRVRLTYSVRPGSSRGYEGYWFEGRMYGLQSGWNAPPTPALSAEWRITFGAQAAKTWQKQDPYITENLSCSTGSQWMDVGDIAQFVGKGKTRQEQEDALQRFTFTVGQANAPMRSREVESAIRQQIADATAKPRQDSLARVARARDDSISKARAARPAGRNGAASGAANGATNRAGAAATTTTTGTVAGQGRVRPGTSTTLDRTGARTNDARQQPATTQRQETYDERMTRLQEERRQAERDSATVRQARAEEASRRVAAQMEANQQRNAEISRTADQVGAAVVNTLGAMLEARRQTREHNEKIDAVRLARRVWHMAKARAFYEAYGPRPRCTAESVSGTIALDGRASGALDGSECRIGDTTSAVLYTLTLDRKRDVELSFASVNGFYPRLVLEGNGVNERGTDFVKADLAPGTYTVAVTTQGPGERGTYTLAADRGRVSRISGWQAGFAYGYGVAGVDALPGDDNADPIGIQGIRMGYGFAEHLSFFGQYQQLADGRSLVDGSAIDVGARWTFRRKVDRVRPYAQLSMGPRRYEDGLSNDRTYSVKGSGQTFGAGVEWFLHENIGFEAGLEHLRGTVSDSQDHDLSATRLTMGLSFHWLRYAR